MITHIVKKTDTLEGIALKYNVSIAKIKKANKIWSNNVLLCMEKILIPEEEDAMSTPSQSKPNSIFNNVDSRNSYSNLPTEINNIYNDNNNNINNNSYNPFLNMNDNSSINSNNNTKTSSIYNYNPFMMTYSESAPNSPVIKSETLPNMNSYNNQIKGDSASERIYYSSSKKDFKRSTSELSSLNELFESIDKTVMDTVNKNNITLPLLIKSQLEVYQDIPTYDPSKDKNNNKYILQKSYSNDSIGTSSNKSNINNSVSSLSLSYDGYEVNDTNSVSSPKELRKSILRHEHEKLNKIMDKLSISTNMDGIHNLVSRFSSRDSYSSITEAENPTSTDKHKQNNDYLELAKIV